MNNLCVAHRGFSSIAPENTMAAFLMAMERPEVQWMELDVQLSRDGVPVVIHDFTVDRTTNGKGLVRETDWADLQRLDAGAWKNKSYKGERIPALSELLDRSCGRVRLNIELKTQGDMYPGLPAAVIHEVRKRHMQNDVVITSFEPAALIEVKKLAPEIQTGLIIDARPGDLLTALRQMNCTFLSIGYTNVDKSLMNEMRSAGIRVMAWTVDDKTIMKKLAAVDPELMLCTNRPDVWELAFQETSSRFFRP
ncbi:glycerophosphodiester phosphodiesterase [Paenibacillus sp. BGI2013]|uniref:Glycerophosphodiester phosphodiesterase family protein n=1 Tax=Paenibacillus amylolyticus TaxID=1451 RepID=A0ABD8AY89_PAEAM|nr:MULTISPECIES: glycerophosphodiester phosphodiesterase family protein [Paenibacillus]KLU53803.1 glycerophosphodiester phosphodiesterase [Paenibacillus sp. VT-400]MCP1425911.1 glycerophosphoryl diester phosphodiesterase [Paenibacillus xylanexedens]MDR6716014.1 glycerophosphoryl diester phosphodiesterase [Paenibacillus sp. 2003]OME99711.1 glycerophosphodiester phosphodiesterase [Paenibacillus amylolyticus]OMF09696.1 glycerophosphodiester phosphodiesterase [Paenibacillus amylolyticus]